MVDVIDLLCLGFTICAIHPITLKMVRIPMSVTNFKPLPLHVVKPLNTWEDDINSGSDARFGKRAMQDLQALSQSHDISNVCNVRNRLNMNPLQGDVFKKS